MENRKDVAKISIFITSVFVILLSGAYAFLNQTLLGTKRQVITAGNLQLELKEKEELILKDALPMYDEVGMIQEPFQFSLQNKTLEQTIYTLRLVNVTGEVTNQLDPTFIKYGLEKNGVSTIGKISDIKETIIDTGIIEGQSIIQYKLRLWIDSTVEDEESIKGKTFHYKIEIEARLKEEEDGPIYIENILNGCDPVLSENLIPVTIDADGTVKKASLYRDWYNYENKRWANAVVLEEGAPDYQSRERIAPEDIESYFVWIPRYKYKLFYDETRLEDADKTIEIEFETKDVQASNGNVLGEWLTHPAFRAFDSNGFWVAKFENGYRGATSEEEARVNSNDYQQLIVKPNTYSWRNTTIGNMFKISYDYLRSDESHMMKNTEWGAVAYLSQSRYGKNANIYINNSPDFVTGCGGNTADDAQSETCQNAYGSKKDGIYEQTTTGNITGIFDMSGGSWEYVMGYRQVENETTSEITQLYPDFFTNQTWNKYYDQYTGDTYDSRILGDATGEMGPFEDNRSKWYGDAGYFPGTWAPWFHRGSGNDDQGKAGIFYFASSTGGAVSGMSFRVVLTP